MKHALLAAALLAGSAVAQTAPPNPTVGGAAMDARRTIPANAAAAPTLSTLVAAVRAAGIEPTLAGPGPFTVFAPTNEAFGRLEPGTVEKLLQPRNRPTLVKLLNNHVVSGAIPLDQLKARIAAGGGAAVLPTLSGDTLTARLEGNALSLTDVKGNRSYLEIPDVRQANGVVHVVNGVLVPRL